MMPIRTALLALALAASASTLAAGEIAPRAGWVVLPAQKPYAELVEAVKAATAQNGMGVVTEAGPTEAAAQRGVAIPGNRVIGVFSNDFAVRVLEVSIAAMIEAPIRFYVTEADDGTATLSYKTPSFVFAPYMDEGGAALADIAAALDERFAAIAAEASR
jgi:uncharacterized protein (DUF302 family)